MRKMIVVLLLVTGIILGMVSVIEVSEEHPMSTEHPSYDVTENAFSNPVPCDGQGGSGGGGVPG